MTVEKLVKELEGELLVRGEGADRRVRRVVASDLMSDVLLVDDEDILLLTSLASDQVLRTAQIVSALGVVVVNGKTLPSTMLEVARTLGVSLATTRLDKFGSCVRVHAAMQR
jgi:hypothetical protein